MGIRKTQSVGRISSFVKPKFKNPKYLRQVADDVPVTIVSNIKSIYPLFVEDFGVGSNVIRISSGESPGGNLLKADIDFIKFQLSANVTNTSPTTGQAADKILRVLTANAIDGPIQNTVNYGDDEVIPQGETKTITRTQTIQGSVLQNAVIAQMFCGVGFSGTVNNLSFSVTVKLL